MNTEVIEVSKPLTREAIVRLEEELKKLPQIALARRDYFAQGVYAREITIPKGVALVGRVHRQSQINIMSKGDFSVTTEQGAVRVQAPFTVASPAGTKRAGYAHEETVWTTILGTELTDPDEIEQLLTAATFDELEFTQYLQLEGDS